MLCHQPHICRFPIQFSINAKWCVITCLLLQHLKSCTSQLPCQRGWEQLVQLGAPDPPHRTKPAATPVPGFVLWEISRNTLSRDAKHSKHPKAAPELCETAGELVDMGYCESQKHGHSIALTPLGSLCFPDYQKVQGYNWGNDCSVSASSLHLYLTTFDWLLPKAQSRVRGRLPDCNRCCDWNYGMKTFHLLA